MSKPGYAEIGTLEVRLIEELAELTQVVCKAQRFGWDSRHPERMNDNIQDALDEIGDVERLLTKLRAHIKLQWGRV